MANVPFLPFIKRGGARLIKQLLNGSIGYEPGMGFYWRCVVDFAKNPGAVGSVALDADTSSDVDLNTAFAENPFPSNVIVHGATIWQESVVDDAGGNVTVATASLGDTGAETGLLNAVDVQAGTGLKGTQGAQSVFHTEAAFAPLLRLATTGANGDDLTAGRFGIRIYFSPHPLYA